MNKLEKKLWFKKNKGKIIKKGTMALSVILLIVGVIYITYSKFDSKVEFTLINGKVVDSGDVKIVSYEYDNEKHNVPPEKDSNYIIDNVDCINANGAWNENEWGLDLRNITGKVKCNLKFIQSYIISYNLNGGTCNDCLTRYTVETDTFTLPIPTKSNYRFIGWSGTGLEGTTNTSVTISKGTTGSRSYTANWEAVVCTVAGANNWYGVYRNGQLSECWWRNPSSGGTKCNGGNEKVDSLTPCTLASNNNYHWDWTTGLYQNCNTTLSTGFNGGGGMSSTYTCP